MTLEAETSKHIQYTLEANLNAVGHLAN